MDYPGSSWSETGDGAQAEVGIEHRTELEDRRDRPTDVIQADLEEQRDRQQELGGVRTRRSGEEVDVEGQRVRHSGQVVVDREVGRVDAEHVLVSAAEIERPERNDSQRGIGRTAKADQADDRVDEV